MPLEGLATSGEIDAATRLFTGMEDAAEAFGVFLRNNAGAYERDVFLDHWNSVCEQRARLTEKNLSKADIESIVTDGYVFFVELTEWVAIYADMLARNVQATAAKQ